MTLPTSTRRKALLFFAPIPACVFFACAVPAQAQQDPKISLNLSTASNSIGQDAHEVVLSVTLEAKNGDVAVYVAEVKQAGVFLVRGFGAGGTKGAGDASIWLEAPVHRESSAGRAARNCGAIVCGRPRRRQKRRFRKKLRIICVNPSANVLFA